MNLSFGEMMVLAIVALVVFGPEKLPEVARNVGRTIAKFRREAHSTLEEFRHSADLRDLRELRDELRDVTAGLKQHSSLIGPPMAARRFGKASPMDLEGFEIPEATFGMAPMDPTVRPTTAQPSTPHPTGVPPFDPDAT
jgi:sec-independent protein translocase protein TatB